MSKSAGSPHQSNLATYLALLGMIGLGLGFLFILAVVMPGLVKIIFLPLFFGLILVLHYVVWGRKMIEEKRLYDARMAESPEPDQTDHEQQG